MKARSSTSSHKSATKPTAQMNVINEEEELVKSTERHTKIHSDIQKNEKKLKDLKLQIRLKKGLLDELADDDKFGKLSKDQQIKQLQDEIVVRNKQIYQLNQQLCEYSAQMKQSAFKNTATPQQTSTKAKHVNAKVTDLEQQILKLNDINELNEKKAQKLINDGTKQVIQFQNKCMDLENENNIYKNQIVDLQQEIQTKDHELFSHAEQMIDYQKEYKYLENNNQNLLNQLNEMHVKVETFEDEKFQNQLKMKDMEELEQNYEAKAGQINHYVELQQKYINKIDILKAYQGSFDKLSHQLNEILSKQKKEDFDIQAKIDKDIQNRLKKHIRELEEQKLAQEATFKQKEKMLEQKENKLEKEQNRLKKQADALKLKEEDVETKKKALIKQESGLKKQKANMEKIIQERVRKEVDEFMKEQAQIKQKKKKMKKQVQKLENQGKADEEKKEIPPEEVKDENQDDDGTNEKKENETGEQPTTEIEEKKENNEETFLTEQPDKDDETKESANKEEKKNEKQQTSPVKKEESESEDNEKDEDESESEEEPSPELKPKEDSDEEDEDEEDEEDEDEEVSSPAVKKSQPKEESDDDEEDDEDEESSDESPKKSQPKKEESDEDDSENDEKEEKESERDKSSEDGEDKPETKRLDEDLINMKLEDQLALYSKEREELTNLYMTVFQELAELQDKVGLPLSEDDKKELAEDLELKTMSLREKLDSKEKEVFALNSKIYDMEFQKKEINRENHKLMKVQQEYKKRVKFLEEKIVIAREERAKEIFEYQNKIKKKDKIISDFKEKCRELETAHRQLQGNQSKMLNNAQFSEVAMREARKNLDIANKKVINYEAILRDMRNQKKKLLEERKITEQNLLKREEKIRRDTFKISALEEELWKRENSLLKKDFMINKLSKTEETKKKEVHELSKKMKQVIKDKQLDASKKEDSKDNEIRMLKEMMKSLQSQLKAKENDVLRLKQKLNTYGTNYSTATSKFTSMMMYNKGPISTTSQNHPANIEFGEKRKSIDLSVKRKKNGSRESKQSSQKPDYSMMDKVDDLNMTPNYSKNTISTPNYQKDESKTNITPTNNSEAMLILQDTNIKRAGQDPGSSTEIKPPEKSEKKKSSKETKQEQRSSEKGIEQKEENKEAVKDEKKNDLKGIGEEEFSDLDPHQDDELDL